MSENKPLAVIYRIDTLETKIGNQQMFEVHYVFPQTQEVGSILWPYKPSANGLIALRKMVANVSNPELDGVQLVVVPEVAQANPDLIVARVPRKAKASAPATAKASPKAKPAAKKAA